MQRWLMGIETRSRVAAKDLQLPMVRPSLLRVPIEDAALPRSPGSVFRETAKKRRLLSSESVPRPPLSISFQPFACRKPLRPVGQRIGAGSRDRPPATGRRATQSARFDGSRRQGSRSANAPSNRPLRRRNDLVYDGTCKQIFTVEMRTPAYVRSTPEVNHFPSPATNASRPERGRSGSSHNGLAPERRRAAYNRV